MKKKLLIIGAIGVLAVAGALGSYLLFLTPHDWQYGLDTAGRGADGPLPWIGAENPELVIHEYLDFDCPHCITGHKRVRSLIAGDLDKVRLVRHNYARMKCAPNNERLRFATCELVRASICASNHMDYWKWNDAIIAAPRTGSAAERKQYVENLRKEMKLPADEFNKCLFDEKTIGMAHEIYLGTKKAGVNATPTYLIDGERVNHAQIVEHLGKL